MPPQTENTYSVCLKGLLDMQAFRDRYRYGTPASGQKADLKLLAFFREDFLTRSCSTGKYTFVPDERWRGIVEP